mgnify:FL=1
MELTVNRKWKENDYTIGKMYVNGIEFSDTLEDKDRGLNDAMSLNEISQRKVYGQTAIPTGTYEVQMTYSSKFANRVWGKKYSGKVPQLLNVKGYSGVRIHPLNTAKDTLGCIGVGKNTSKGMITSSIAYYYKLLDEYILPAIKRKERILITIK